MPIQHERVKSVASLIKRISELRTEWNSADGLYFDPWFRGQARKAWALSPSLYRRDISLASEEDMRSEFMRRGVQLTNGPSHTGEWAWYFLQQHYGCPTRLLDWTDSALVALFFAINSNHPSEIDVDSDAAVWMIDPWWLNQQALGRKSIVLSDWEEAQPYLPKLYSNRALRRRYPIAIDPPHLDRRVAVQRSRFTIHGSHRNGFESLARKAGARLVCISIARSSIDTMRIDLATCGITDAVLFPDLQGLSRDLERNEQANWFDIS